MKQLNYYHNSVRVASWVAEWLRILGNKKNSRKPLKCLGLMASTQPALQPAKSQVLTVFGNKLQKISLKRTWKNLFCLFSWIYLQPFVQNCEGVGQQITWALKLNDKWGALNKTCRSLSSASNYSTLATYNYWSLSYIHTYNIIALTTVASTTSNSWYFVCNF